MKRRKKIIQDKKLRGEWAESVFVVCANEHKIPVNKPWGEMNSYDFVVGRTRRFVSVQVKSTTEVWKTGYVCTVRSGHKAYAPGSFDFLAAYVVAEDVWYIIPAESIRGKGCITLFPNSKNAKYEPYREAWHLLRQAAGLKEDENWNEDDATSNHADPPSAELLPQATPVPRFPTNALERFQASADFYRRAMEGHPLRPPTPDQKK